jgi:CheY-like chemotaxis protein
MSLKKMSYKVAVADDGLSAIERYKKHASTLKIILMDINLGAGMDGVEAVRHIRQHERELIATDPAHEHAFVLGLTGNVDEVNMK